MSESPGLGDAAALTRSDALPDCCGRAAAEAEVSADLHNARLAAIVSYSPDAIISTGADGRVIRSWNPAASRVFGWHEAEAVGATIDALLIPEHLKDERETLLASLARNETVLTETERRHKSGALIPVEINAAAILDSDGRVAGYSVVFRDITERKRAAEALSANERFSRAVLEASPDCLKVIDAEGRLTFMNANGLQLMEIDDFASCAGAFWSDLWPEAERARIDAVVRAAQAGVAGRFEAFCPTAKGAPRWWDVSVSPIMDANGRVSRIVSTSRDLTDRKRQEQTLSSSEARLQLALSASNAAAWLWNVGQEIVEVSDGYRDLLGLSAEGPLMYSDWLARLHPDDRDASDRRVLAVLAEGATLELEFRILHPERGLRWLSAHGRVERDAAGVPVRMIGINIDITDRKRAEETLAHRDALLAGITERARIGLYMLDRDWRFTYANRAYLETIGLQPRDVTGRSAKEVVSALRFEEVRGYHERAMAGETVTFERQGAVPGATVPHAEWRLISLQPHRDASDRIIGIIGIVVDIAQRKQVEQALAESAEHLRHREAELTRAQRIARIGSYEVTRVGDGFVNRRSPEYLAIHGLSPEDVNESHEAWVARIHPDDRERSEASFKSAISEGATEYQAEYRIIRPSDGETRWIRVLAEIDRDGTGLVKLVGTHIDITEMKRAEAALRNNEAFLRDVLDTLPEHVCVLDRQGIVRAVNEPWRRFAVEHGGRPDAVVAGADYLMVCRRAADQGDTDARAALVGLQALLAGTRETFEMEYPCHVPGRALWYMLYARRLTRGMGGVIVSHLDITARKEAELALAESEGRLRLALAAGGMGTWETDFVARRRWRSEEARAILGVPPGDIAWREVPDSVHADDVTLVRELRDRLDAGLDEIDIEYRLSIAGETRWVRVRGGVTGRDADGKCARASGVLMDITARKLAEDATKEALRLVENVMASAPVSIYIHDVTAGRNELVNSRAGELLGYDAGEWAQKVASVLELMHPEDLPRLFDHLERLAHEASQTPLELEYRMRHKDGSWRHFLSRDLVYARHPDGRLHKVLGTATDVTRLKKLEAELRDSEARARSQLDEIETIYASAHVGLCVLDRDLRFVRVNRRMAEVNGLPAEAHIGRTVREVVPALADAVEEIAARIFATGEPVIDFELTGETAAQTGIARTWVEQWLPLRDWQGEIVGINLAVEEVTERKRAEEALRESEARFRTIVTTAQEGIWAIDRDGRTTLANPRMAELLGTTVEAMQGRSCLDFFVADDIEAGRERIAASLAGHTEEFEWRFRRADGSPLHVLAATAPMRGHDGSVVGALGGFLDLSERKKAEERQNVLMREIAHRGKNLLAVVQSIAGRTLDGQRSLAEARVAFIGRLQALARTYSALTDEVFEGAPLDAIVAGELASFGARVHMEGPRIMLTAKVSQTMALVVHELATNAAKYGALSVPTGRLDVHWRTSGEGDDRVFHFDWRETGGPPAETPKRCGFGSVLISQVAGAEFDCTPELVFGPEGLRYALEAQLAAVGSIIDESPVRERLQSETLRGFYDAWASLKGRNGAAPVLKRFDRARFAATGGLTLAAIGEGGEVKFLEVGRALQEELGRLVRNDELAGDGESSHREAYLTCSRGSSPCYEHLRFDFGGGDTVTFERLLVPFSLGGRRITHVAGLVVFTGRTRSP